MSGSIPYIAIDERSGTSRIAFRWGLCWYGQAVVTRPVAGSIPAAGAQRPAVPGFR